MGGEQCPDEGGRGRVAPPARSEEDDRGRREGRPEAPGRQESSGHWRVQRGEGAFNPALPRKERGGPA